MCEWVKCVCACECFVFLLCESDAGESRMGDLKYYRQAQVKVRVELENAD